MLSLAASLNRTKDDGAPQALPDVLLQLAESKYRVHLRRSQVSMVAGATGSGKTILAQWVAINAGVPTLYFSADTDETTMAERAVAMLTGVKQDVIRCSGPSETAWYADQLHERTSHIAWDYEPDHDTESLEVAVRSFGMVYGQWPHLIVLDVLLSFQQGAGQWGDMTEVMLLCKALAQRTRAHVMILHHTTGEWTDRVQAPPRSAIMNKIDQFPSLILTVGRDQDVLHVAVVKNRNGPSDVKADHPVAYIVDLDRAQLLDPTFRRGTVPA